MASQQEIYQQIQDFEGSPDPFITAAIHNTASAIVEQSVNVQPGQRVLLWFDTPGTPLVKEMYNRCIAKGAEVAFFHRDYDKDAQEISGWSESDWSARFDEEERLINNADAVLLVRNPEHPEAMSGVPPELVSRYNEQTMKAHNRRVEGAVKWNLMLWPTEYEAAIEGLDYKDYFRLVMEACNQNWDEIKKAQDILIAKLNAGKTIQFIANEEDDDPKRRTNVTMSIDGMTFCNSTITRNYPGSEVFSAPVLDSVNGQLFAGGDMMYDGYKMKDVFFKIEKGRIVEAHAEEGNEALQQILYENERLKAMHDAGQIGGPRYFGEVALGTNPGITRRFFNGLLNEKMSGFHMAVGHCYSYTEYDGVPVHVNNGNTSDNTGVHWDVTVSMLPLYGGGKVIVDGEIIQENGIFKDPQLSVLNPHI